MRYLTKICIFFAILLTCMFVVGDVWYYGSGEAVNLENKIGFDKHSQKVISAQATDPTSGAGVVAATGSIMLHTASGAYIKTGAANTDWKLIVDQRFLDNVHSPHGWQSHSASSFGYDINTHTLTVTYSPSETLWFNGKSVVQTAVDSAAHADAIGAFFFYYTVPGDLVASAAGGTFNWDTQIPAALVYHNDTAADAPWAGPDYVLFDERHTIIIPYATQREMHYADGAVLKNNGFTITGTYSTATGTGTVADNSYGIATGTLIDQDFEHSFTPLTDNAGIGNQFPVWYRIGASNEWRWVINNVPYYGGTNINYNLNTGGTYSLAETGNGNYINMYAITWNVYGASNAQRFAWIMGQAQYTTLALAQGENITSLNLTGIPAQEILGLYRVTMRCQSTYDDTGKNTRIEAITRITDVRVNATITFNPSTAAAVTVNTTNFDNNLSATDTTVQTALDTIDDIVIATTSAIKTTAIIDLKSNGSSGGTFTQGDWRTRDLGTLVGDTGLVTVGSNQMTIATGSYMMNCNVPAYAVGNHQARLRNITDGTTTALGTSVYAHAANGVSNSSSIYTMFTITDSKVFEVQHYCNSTNADDGFGVATSSGTNEIFTQCLLTQLPR